MENTSTILANIFAKRFVNKKLARQNSQSPRRKFALQFRQHQSPTPTNLEPARGGVPQETNLQVQCRSMSFW